MNIALVDDMQTERDALRDILRSYAAANRLELEIDTFSSAEALLEAYRPFRYTVVFLDIYMGGMTGVEAAERLRAQDSDVLLIFLTSSGEHMPDAFRFHAYDYIQKPADTGRLYRVMDDILKRHTSADVLLTFISDRTEYSLPFGEIVAVCSDGHYLEITDRSGTVYKARMTFSTAAGLLSRDKRFLLILRGILVNMDCILDFNGGACHLKGGLRLPINVRNSRKIEQTWQNYVFSKIRADALEKGGRS